MSKEAKNLILKLLILDPLQRITAKEALKDIWFFTKTSKNIHPKIVEKLTIFTKQNKLKRHALTIIAKFMNENDIKNLKQQFLNIDTDKSGEISVSELSEAMKKVGFDPTNQQVKDLLNEMDANGNGLLDYNEFLAATIEEHLYLKDDILHKAFDFFDKDNTGSISHKNLLTTLGDKKTEEVKEFVQKFSSSTTGEINFNDFKRLMTSSNLQTQTSNSISKT